MSETFAGLGPILLAIVQFLVAAVASAHAVLFKRDVRAAIGWIALIWLVPLAGALLYAMFGINRIRRRATLLRAKEPSIAQPPAAVRATAPPEEPHHPLTGVRRLLDQITPAPLTQGNEVVVLGGGTTAYRQMIEAIDRAERSVCLATYIFDADACGRGFAAALERAVGRGVAVRVLIDGVGARYSIPPIGTLLRAAGVPTAEFLPTLFPLHLPYANLRNHRKILVADGRVGFTGGMNIRCGHLDTAPPADAIQDLHFRLRGPVVAHLVEAFADDWQFTTREPLSGPDWFPPVEAAGTVLARGIAAGPDESFERIRWAILGAISLARRSIRIATPYFLPDTMLSTSLMLAALRGVAVDVVVPRRNNLRLVRWASLAKVDHLLARGCRVWESPPPFDHSKLMTVDGLWSLIGSANWDPRSLRLNFELNVECYDSGLAAELDALLDRKIAAATPLTLDALARRPLAAKLRDGAAWLLSPYL
jgi:cardiolipin synthase